MPERATAIENIDFNKSDQYTLSIRLSTDGFSFSVYNPLHEGETYYSNHAIDPTLSLTANLKQFFRTSEIPNHPYKRVNIVMKDKRFTMVPLELFEEEQIETIFHHNHPQKGNETILYNVLKKNNIVVIFGIDKSTHQFLTEQYPEAKFYSQVAPMSEYLSSKSRAGNSRKLYASFQPSNMDVYCYERGRLLLVNSYECKFTEDRIYYLLYLWKQLEFDQEKDELHLTGTISDKEKLTKELKTFISQVFIIPISTFTNIETLTLCEL
ncbi:DUF3822 family protein [uncultured Bacteroides sp.]|uniref:DUF3822 family protein n=1 Tax=uncultured Bacteroides sp. TaxID=162156 RepID=UPI002AAB9007|nr:DUF3822 family protein [uncultured Bacteroides sp.]